MSLTFPDEVKEYVEAAALHVPAHQDSEIVDRAIQLLEQRGLLRDLKDQEIKQIRRQVEVELGIIRVRNSSRSLGRVIKDSHDEG